MGSSIKVTAEDVEAVVQSLRDGNLHYPGLSKEGIEIASRVKITTKDINEAFKRAVQELYERER
ncbi:hypothetical protein [Pseudoduganella violacea]|uniref:Uncharacterized protein n=1 Tax=Pseudoduganella violacea TaxID=1715466 RepID=A0A7W5BA74_9BURK|nr:hypothetical protein [Pseudoduganella violacea]MBB3119417.1 hypothetical protein [Pseudoduganella violacea]